MSGRARIAVLVAAAIAGATACGGSSSSPGASGSATNAHASPVAVATYGYAPTSDTRGHLAPDVVVVDGGANAVRSASVDGLTWTIDGKAQGASRLRVGSVLLLTSRAVG